MSDAICALSCVTAEDLFEPDSSDSEQSSSVHSPPYSPFSLPSSEGADDEEKGEHRQVEEDETISVSLV